MNCKDQKPHHGPKGSGVLRKHRSKETGGAGVQEQSSKIYVT